MHTHMADHGIRNQPTEVLVEELKERPGGLPSQMEYLNNIPHGLKADLHHEDKWIEVLK